MTQEHLWGTDLTPEDYQRLAERWIPPELADTARIERVNSPTGRQMLNRKSGELSGLIIPNIFPGETSPRSYRLRLDQPQLEYRADGSVKAHAKYLSPPEQRNLLYFAPGTPPEWLQDTQLAVVITEGEFKTLALDRLSRWNVDQPRFLGMGLGGVWNFRGVVGKTQNAKGQRVEVKGIISDIERVAWAGRRVVIAFDADLQHNSSVRAARWHLTSALIDRGAIVGDLEWPSSEGKGIDDRLAAVGPEKVLTDLAAIEFGDWRLRLIRTDKGSLAAAYDNVARFMERDPEWSGAIGYNEFDGGYYVLKQPPAPVSARIGDELEDHFDVEATRWLERKLLVGVRPDMVKRVVDSVARHYSFHPVRDYLESLPPWDGKTRIASWVIDYLGVPSSDSNPNEFAMDVGQRWLISAIARIMQPGCKADHMLVLEGKQGTGKSTAAKILGRKWHTDQVTILDTKDASMQLRGAWIVEFAELGQFGRVEQTREKAFLTYQEDRFRLPYGRRVVKFSRQCVFIGTTNRDDWLKDETGGRRFWPVRCENPIDVEALARDVDQLWAEALLRYREGVPWYITDEHVVKEAIKEQRHRFQQDVWQRAVIESAEEIAATRFTYGPKAGSAAVAEILGKLGVEVPKQDVASANRVARCLAVAGWRKRYLGSRGDREYRYVRSAAMEDDD